MTSFTRSPIITSSSAPLVFNFDPLPPSEKETKQETLKKITSEVAISTLSSSSSSSSSSTPLAVSSEKDGQQMETQTKTSEAVESFFGQAKKIAGYLDGSGVPVPGSPKEGQFAGWFSPFGKFFCRENHYIAHVMKFDDLGNFVDTTPPCSGCLKTAENVGKNPAGVEKSIQSFRKDFFSAPCRIIKLSKMILHSNYRTIYEDGRESFHHNAKIIIETDELLKGKTNAQFRLLYNRTLYHIIVDPKSRSMEFEGNSDRLWDVDSKTLDDFRKNHFDGSFVVADLSWTDVIPVPPKTS